MASYLVVRIEEEGTVLETLSESHKGRFHPHKARLMIARAGWMTLARPKGVKRQKAVCYLSPNPQGVGRLGSQVYQFHVEKPVLED